MAKRNKMLRKVLVTMCSAVLLVGATVGVTVAYLTSTDSVENTFTVGKVVISMDEADVDVYGVEEKNEDGTPKDRVTANTYKIIPGHNYVKDPTVYVEAGSEDSYLFVKVTNGISDIEADPTIADQMGDRWTLVNATEGIYRYNDIVNAGDEITVFEGFAIKSDVTDASVYEGKKITIVACAVQADGMTPATALEAATFTK